MPGVDALLDLGFIWHCKVQFRTSVRIHHFPGTRPKVPFGGVQQNGYFPEPTGTRSNERGHKICFLVGYFFAWVLKDARFLRGQRSRRTGANRRNPLLFRIRETLLFMASKSEQPLFGNHNSQFPTPNFKSASQSNGPYSRYHQLTATHSDYVIIRPYNCVTETLAPLVTDA